MFLIVSLCILYELTLCQLFLLLPSFLLRLFVCLCCFCCCMGDCGECFTHMTFWWFLQTIMNVYFVYQILYVDGDEEILRLEKERWRFISVGRTTDKVGLDQLVSSSCYIYLHVPLLIFCVIFPLPQVRAVSKNNELPEL